MIDEVLRNYQLSNIPNGLWEGILDCKRQIGNLGLYCCFTAQNPPDLKGQKFRLLAKASKGFRPHPAAPDMRDEQAVHFRLVTKQSKKHIIGEWLDAEIIE
ncbi:hypothetical protein [Pseudodesulfovibrio senegalensis]|uniref:Uncharacterized protein n=1 Tax=Pseudodesulfovibrio senegalensis TaxID=1721087 RepID=A0A6N6MWL2_9BACT|nr:hypothetical protein [Pseudodesulfovibrio senegalensis]KAB1437309.1 hypothetical protein F8A88_15395 [Pseudodesulfovibrio senegalensis]